MIQRNADERRIYSVIMRFVMIKYISVNLKGSLLKTGLENYFIQIAPLLSIFQIIALLNT